MTVDRNTHIFFDASCLIAAAGNPQGGSGFLLALCASGYFKPVISQPVLLEAQKNIQQKLGVEALNRFYNLLIVVPFFMASIPKKEELGKFSKAVNKKDVHVLAAAVTSNSTFLLALDRGLLLEVKKSGFEINALTPGEFIKGVLPSHVDFPIE